MSQGKPTNLKEILFEFSEVIAPGGTTKSTLDRHALEKRLRLVERRCQNQYAVWLTILATAFIFAVIVVWAMTDNPKHAAAVLGATGLTVGAILPKLREAEREISRIRLFIALVGSVSDAHLAAIVTALAAKL
jgi:hypothetical protein